MVYSLLLLHYITTKLLYTNVHNVGDHNKKKLNLLFLILSVSVEQATKA